MFDTSVSSEVSYETFTSIFTIGYGPLPGVLVKLVVLGLIWSYLHHFCAGVRHLWMDATHSVSKEQGHSSAVISFAVSLLLTVALGAKAVRPVLIQISTFGPRQLPPCPKTMVPSASSPVRITVCATGLRSVSRPS